MRRRRRAWSRCRRRPWRRGGGLGPLAGHHVDRAAEPPLSEEGRGASPDHLHPLHVGEGDQLEVHIAGVGLVDPHAVHHHQRRRGQRAGVEAPEIGGGLDAVPHFVEDDEVAVQRQELLQGDHPRGPDLLAGVDGDVGRDPGGLLRRAGKPGGGDPDSLHQPRGGTLPCRVVLRGRSAPGRGDRRASFGRIRPRHRRTQKEQEPSRRDRETVLHETPPWGAAG